MNLFLFWEPEAWNEFFESNIEFDSDDYFGIKKRNHTQATGKWLKTMFDSEISISIPK